MKYELFNDCISHSWCLPVRFCCCFINLSYSEAIFKELHHHYVEKQSVVLRKQDEVNNHKWMSVCSSDNVVTADCTLCADFPWATWCHRHASFLLSALSCQTKQTCRGQGCRWLLGNITKENIPRGRVSWHRSDDLTAGRRAVESYRLICSALLSKWFPLPLRTSLCGPHLSAGSRHP